MEILLHIADEADWRQARKKGCYVPSGFAEEGFVHLSTPATLPIPANLFFAGRDDLVLLWIDPARLTAEVRWEPGGGEAGDVLFPHLYGPVALDAVVGVSPLARWPPAGFQLPPAPLPAQLDEEFTVSRAPAASAPPKACARRGSRAGDPPRRDP